MLRIRRLKPKWAIFCDKFLNLLFKNSFDVLKNKKKAAVIKIVLIKKLILSFLKIKIDKIKESIKN